MFCSSCGNKLPEGGNARFCPECGSPVGPQVQNAKVSQEVNGASVNTSSIADSFKQIDVDAIKNIDYKSYQDKAVSNYQKTSFCLVVIALLVSNMSWIKFETTRLTRRVMQSFGIGESLSLYKYISIQDDMFLTILLYLGLFFAGLILGIISYVKREEHNEKYVKLGKYSMLLMGIGGLLACLFTLLHLSAIRDAGGLVSLGTGAYLWTICSILQIVLYVLVTNKAKTRMVANQVKTEVVTNQVKTEAVASQPEIVVVEDQVQTEEVDADEAETEEVENQAETEEVDANEAETEEVESQSETEK